MKYAIQKWKTHMNAYWQIIECCTYYIKCLKYE